MDVYTLRCSLKQYYETLGIKENADPSEIHSAYRLLARKWHPDRYPEGPERAWAENKMIDINIAYNALVSHAHASVPPAGGDRFQEIRFLIEAGQLSRARKLMSAMVERDAEWHYHFGLMLYQRKDYDKAATYFSIASKKDPESGEYRRALQNAKLAPLKKRFGFLRKLLHIK